jgi:hypothetical protein
MRRASKPAARQGPDCAPVHEPREPSRPDDRTVRAMPHRGSWRGSSIVMMPRRAFPGAVRACCRRFAIRSAAGSRLPNGSRPFSARRWSAADRRPVRGCLNCENPRRLLVRGERLPAADILVWIHAHLAGWQGQDTFPAATERNPASAVQARPWRRSIRPHSRAQRRSLRGQSLPQRREGARWNLRRRDRIRLGLNSRSSPTLPSAQIDTAASACTDCGAALESSITDCRNVGSAVPVPAVTVGLRRRPINLMRGPS